MFNLPFGSSAPLRDHFSLFTFHFSLSSSTSSRSSKSAQSFTLNSQFSIFNFCTLPSDIKPSHLSTFLRGRRPIHLPEPGVSLLRRLTPGYQPLSPPGKDLNKVNLVVKKMAPSSASSLPPCRKGKPNVACNVSAVATHQS